MPQETCHRISPEDVTGSIPGEDGKRFVVAFARGELQVELYRPIERDFQQPHSRDECYVILEGTGMFFMGGERVPFKPGDFLFVPAGVDHRFENFGESMTTWVIFYGLEGGQPE